MPAEVLRQPCDLAADLASDLAADLACDRALAAVRRVAFAPLRVGQVLAADGATVTVSGLSAAIGDLVELAGDGGPVPAEVIGFRSGELIALPLAAGTVRPAARVVHIGRADLVAVGAGLLGRVVDGWGQPIDGLGAMAAEGQWPRGGVPLAPLDRSDLCVPMWTGVRPIDTLLTLGRGQRVGLMAGSGVGKTALMQQLIMGAAADVVVVALLGERGREIAAFVHGMGAAARARAHVIAVPADDAPGMRVRGVERAFAVAEYWRSLGAHALLLVDSLTRVAHAQRQLGLAVGEPAGPRGYPASALAMIPRLVERAGNDGRTGGAVTAIMTVLADGDDLVGDPVVDAARGVMDGHIMLARSVAAGGRFPAIDVGHSLSRTMDGVAEPWHVAAAARFRADFARLELVRELRAMGAYVPGQDAAADRALALEGAMEALLRQDRHQSLPHEQSLAALQSEWAT